MFVFRNAGGRQRHYNAFMNNVFSYSPYLSERGLKKQHDDAPDVLAQAVELITHGTAKYSIHRRPW